MHTGKFVFSQVIDHLPRYNLRQYMNRYEDIIASRVLAAKISFKAWPSCS
ncbi:MAG: hypothetical protein OXC62_15615 [Aestuariivita sp.]|nr:hypothetical protein [Aestuariivita sp.]